MTSKLKYTPPPPEVILWEYDSDSDLILHSADECKICYEWYDHYDADIDDDSPSLIAARQDRDAKEKAEEITALTRQLEKVQQELEEARRETASLSKANDDLKCQLAHKNIYQLDSPRLRKHPHRTRTPSPHPYIFISSTESSPSTSALSTAPPLAGPSRVSSQVDASGLFFFLESDASGHSGPN
jgi:hypothetical protein